MSNQLIADFLYICAGVAMTLKLLLGSILVGLSLGVLFAIARYRNICRGVIKGIVSVIRGTPSILQLSIVYFVIPQVYSCKLDVITTGIIAFGINSSAYVSEILRAGIESLPKGQFEAAYSLGIPPFYMWKDIILPQVAANVFPAIVNETVTLLKETALVATIGGADIMRRSQIIAASRYEYLTPLCVAGLVYYLLVLVLEFAGREIEKRQRPYAKNP